MTLVVTTMSNFRSGCLRKGQPALRLHRRPESRNFWLELPEPVLLEGYYDQLQWKNCTGSDRGLGEYTSPAGVERFEANLHSFCSASLARTTPLGLWISRRGCLSISPTLTQVLFMSIGASMTGVVGVAAAPVIRRKFPNPNPRRRTSLHLLLLTIPLILLVQLHPSTLHLHAQTPQQRIAQPVNATRRRRRLLPPRPVQQALLVRHRVC
jgi:hypothetical protein